MRLSHAGYVQERLLQGRPPDLPCSEPASDDSMLAGPAASTDTPVVAETAAGLPSPPANAFSRKHHRMYPVRMYLSGSASNLRTQPGEQK